MKQIEKYLDKLNDQLNLITQIDDYDLLQEEVNEVESNIEILRNVQNNDMTTNISDDFCIAISRDLEHLYGTVCELNEKITEYKKEAEIEAEESEQHYADMSSQNRYI